MNKRWIFLIAGTILFFVIGIYSMEPLLLFFMPHVEGLMFSNNDISGQFTQLTLFAVSIASIPSCIFLLHLIVDFDNPKKVFYTVFIFISTVLLSFYIRYLYLRYAIMSMGNSTVDGEIIHKTIPLISLWHYTTICGILAGFFISLLIFRKRKTVYI
jgi:hypothetical protein